MYIAEEGIYRNNLGIFRVKTNVGNGRRYAEKLDIETQKFEYYKGAVTRLRPETRLTLEEAKAFGAMYGFCVACGRTLSNEYSIAAGLGPICASKF